MVVCTDSINYNQKQENKQIFILFSIILDVLQKVNIEAMILYLGTDFLNVNLQNVSTLSAHILFLSSKIYLLCKKREYLYFSKKEFIMTEKQKTMIKKKKECKGLWETTDLSGEEIAKKVCVSPTTFWRWKNTEGWIRNSAKNVNPLVDNTEKTKNDKVLIEFKSISLNQYNELLYAIQTDDALSKEAKGLAIELLPGLLDNTELLTYPRVPFDTDMKFLTSKSFTELVNNDYIAEHQENSNFSYGRKRYEFKVLDTVSNLKEKLLEKEKEIAKLNEILKRYKEIGDLYD